MKWDDKTRWYGVALVERGSKRRDLRKVMECRPQQLLT